METLAQRLIAARTEKGWTQGELAKAAGLKGQSIIGMLESGGRKSSSYIPQIAHALGVAALWLSKGEGPKSADCRDKSHADAGGVLLSLNSSKEPDPPKYLQHEERTFFGAEVLARFARLTPEGQDLARTMLVAGIAEAERRHPVQANAS